MPNYRQKNKRNKNKNRQKNQQQQQQQQQQQNKNKNQNLQEPEIQQTDQNRQPTNNQDNQSQGQSRREQSNQHQQQQPTTSPQSPKSPTPTATQTTPAASEDEPRTATSPQQQPPSSEDAREVDSDVPAAALNQCHNLNSNEPTTSHQTFTTAVEREECNRVEDADAQLSKLDNKEATHSDIARIEEIVGAECDSAVQESTMGNKDSKSYITSDDDAATTTTAATTATVTASTDLCGISRPDRTIAGARELDELHTAAPKTQMAKVIVHRIVRETTSEGGENEPRIGDIDKVEQVASVGEQLTSGKTGELKVEVMDEQKTQVTATDGQIEGFAQQKQVQSAAKEVETMSETQQPKVIVHKIEQKPVEAQKANHKSDEPKIIVHAIQQEEDDLTIKQQTETFAAQTTSQMPQSNAGAKVIVHKIAQTSNNNAGPSQIQRDEADNSRATPANSTCVSPKGRPEQIDDSKVIIHHIQLESTSPINYRVDSPDTDSPTSQLYRSKQAHLLNKSIVQIQELSDESSSEYNDNPPVISEAESETESTAGACALDYAQAVRTLSPDSEVSYEVSHKPPAIPSQEQQDLKQRRAQKRVALETHFLPQLLSPRYLDSIMEENSDMSDARSDCSENPLMTTHSGDDLHDATASKVRKANEVFPRSNLDFTRRHAKKQLGALPKKPLPIREEPVAMVVAAKLIDNAITPAQECCTRLSSEHTPESEAAEVIYLSSSASSSLSDLMELDAEGDGDDECGNSSRSTIDLDTDAREIITRPGSEECAATASDSRESTPVNQASTRLSENNETQKIHTNNNNNASGWVEQTTPAAAAVNGTNIDTAKITNPIEHRIFENLKSLQLLAEPSGERTLSNGSGETKTSTTTTSISKRTITTHSESETETETSSETTTERCEYLRSSSSSGSGNGSGSSSLTSSIDAKYPPAIIATSDSLNVDPAVLLENIELEMNSVRDILNSHTIETTATTCGNQHVSDTRTSCELKNIDKFNSAKNVSPSPPPIPPPPTSASASDFHSDFTGFQTQSAPQPPPPIPARAPQDNTFNSASTFTTEQKSPQTQTTNTLSPNTHNALTTLSLLSRQESAESHCSDSTQHSQCTAINVGSRPSTDHELTPPLTAISPISDAQQQRQHTEWKYGENSESDVNTRGQQNDLELPSAEQKDAAIKKLRLLCTETLASMPYGEQVLVELATVAQNIGELQAKAPTQTPAEKSSALPQGTTHATNMPYPLPQLPHISELQLSIAADDRTPTTLSEPKRAQASHSATSSHTTTTHNVAITQRSDPVGASRDLTAASAKLLHSPPPPPVPVPPARYSDAPWLGVPTAADPNVLVCLSPAQQQQLTSGTQSSQQAGAQQTPQPDQLLDAHQKFLERRGYHEYTDEQVKSLNAELQQEEQQILKTAAYMKKLRKSLTPPPPPVPPPPVPAKNAETAAKAQNQARIAASSSHVSSDHSQRVYDVIQDRNANEQIAATFANGEQQRQQIQANQSEQKRLLTLTQKADASADAVAVSVDGSSSTTSSAHQQTSSLENNSRQTSAADAAAATAAAQGGAPAFAGKQPTASADTRQYSNANASASTSISRVSDLYAANNYTKNSFPTTATTSTSSANMQGVESELAKMFPTMGSSDIFDSNRKRFSNIESSTTSKDGAYCAQLQSTLPKRYSNIETHSYEAKKRMENGQVVYDYSDSRHERQSDGDKSLESASTPSLLQFPVREPSKEYLQYPVAGDGVSSRSGNSEIMSAIKLNTTENAKTTTQETNVETKEQTNGINMTNFVHPAATSNATATSTTATTQHNPTDRTFGTTATTETTIKEEHIKNSQEFGSSTARPQASSGGGDSGNAYEEFRQRAKAAADGGALGAFGGQTPATAPPLGQGNSKHSAFNFQHDKLFKDFDALSQQLHMELEEGKAQRQQREKSASLFDLNRSQWNFKDHFDELKQQRHQHMQELEREIERSMRSRQLKGWANGGAQNTTSAPTAGRTYEIPIQIEQNNGAYDSAHSNGFARKSDRSSAPRELTQPRAYNIPIVMENGDAPVPPPPPADYDTVDDASRFRRAESMFNLSENTRRAQPQTPQTYATYERPKSAAADDWARYASDFGSSENITRPFAREVEICYQRQRPRTIRAPRLSASTNDLSSYTHSYDNYNAYNARRSHAPMLQPVAQQQRPHHGSCYSVLERDPNPTYISTTTRRGVSPAPVSPAPQATAQEPLYSPHAPERQRRASLPREIQEQQLKYISSKEEELRMEFERLQNERRRLMEELNTPPAATLQMPQHPMRDIYRPVPKLPTLTEDEVFRQQMAEEWLSKVAEREERRLQKIIKISKVNETQQGQQPPVPPQPKTDISDEFLKRVQERRTKLAMPADSDWESGAESQPARAGHASESDAEVPPVKVIEGKSEADLRQLPRHLREFARFSNHNEEKIDGGHRVVHQEEERRQEANGNSMSSALKKSSVVKTVKIARPEIVTNTSQRVAPPPVSVQQHQQPRQQPQQGHSRPVSGGETVVTRRSHISTASSSTRSSYETHTKLQQSSISSTGGAAGGAMGGANHQQQPHSHLKHHNHQQQHQHHHHHQHSHSHKASSSSSRPPAPHVRTCKKTRFLLEPNRRSWSESDLLKEIDSELKLAKGFLYANAFERSASTSALYSPAARRRHDTAQPFYKPNEVIFKVKHEYMSEPETEHDRPRKMAQLGRRQVDGIGPVTNDGMPIILRSEVKEPHQHEWYKRLYQTIHKQKSGDDYVIRYKCQRARPQLKATGYQSEPEPNYDSDYSTVKYRTLDRRRLQSVSSATNVANRHTNTYQDDKLYGTMPNPIKSEQNQYKNQPGRIEDYVTGRSSVSEKERKEWWDEVMDIFNGHLEQTKLSPHYTEGNLSRALAKESGYASDSNLVFRKRDVPQASPLSPVEQKQAYKSVQAGGEPPLFGFRKPAPERPKDDGNDPPVPPKPSGYRAESPNRYLESDVNIHFKTPIRHEYKQAMSDEDLAQRQAEQMQKLYQEERRRKYLQELQDMNARRHTDNFTPTQKSPIPLNRYDDFQSDLAPKSPNAITTRTAARALYNFQGQNARELTFKKGDIIYIRRQIDRNWYEGEFNAMIGLLPVSYVEVVNKETARQQPKKPSEGQARAKYNFQAQSGIELSLNKGELVTLTRRVDDNWFEGKIANRKGIFPVSYVEVLTDIGAEDIAARTVITEQASVTNLRPSLDTLRTNINNEFNLITKNGHQPPNGILKETKHHNNKIDALHVDTHSEPLVYRALYKYRPQNSDEMELLEGDIVHVLEICDDGWFVGTSQRTGCFGTFPGNYVERVR
ncbi:serine-rich adhesin for platelets isoform X27 [Bactrocera neohumeralis]|uniref:serine-rich adhesin for platelets isoform X27 n=1 Tax=Bactrocera neohumeralis TaxID=98809 RepID=UPI0021665DED|nr:serine-rich adhesin for platelets isoform X27 [Bactrocera neohumeralis]